MFWHLFRCTSKPWWICYPLQPNHTTRLTWETSLEWSVGFYSSRRTLWLIRKLWTGIMTCCEKDEVILIMSWAQDKEKTPTGNEPMILRAPVGCSNRWALTHARNTRAVTISNDKMNISSFLFHLLGLNLSFFCNTSQVLCCYGNVSDRLFQIRKE